MHRYRMYCETRSSANFVTIDNDQFTMTRRVSLPSSSECPFVTKYCVEQYCTEQFTCYDCATRAIENRNIPNERGNLCTDAPHPFYTHPPHYPTVLSALGEIRFWVNAALSIFPNREYERQGAVVDALPRGRSAAAVGCSTVAGAVVVGHQ